MAGLHVYHLTTREQHFLQLTMGGKHVNQWTTSGQRTADALTLSPRLRVACLCARQP